MSPFQKTIILSALLTFPFLIYAQNDWEKVSHKLGFSFELPAKLEVKHSEKWLKFEGWLKDPKTYLRGGVGFQKKEEFKRWTFGYYQREGFKFEPIQAAQNKHFQERKGIPAFYMMDDSEGSLRLQVWAEFDAENFLQINFSHLDSAELEQVEPLLWKIISTVKIDNEQEYESNWEDEHLFEPLPFDGSALAKVEGPLAGKVTHYAYDLPSYIDWEGLEKTGPSVAALPDGGFVMSWLDTLDNTHLLRFNKNMEADERPIRIKGLRCEALVGDNQGFTGFFARGKGEWHEDYMHGYLIGFDKAGKKRFQTEVVGTRDVDIAEEQWVHLGRNQISLAFSGKHYAVYISTSRNFGSRGTHQGDLLRFYDETGKIIMGSGYSRNSAKGWHWGVSHSFSKAICWDGEAFSMMTVGDGHPRGMAFSRIQSEEMKEDFSKVETKDVWHIAGEKGNNDAKYNVIGGIQADGTQAMAVFTSALKAPRTSKSGATFSRMHTAFIQNERQKIAAITLDPEKMALNPKIIRLGKNNLLIWAEMNGGGLSAWSTYTDLYAIYSTSGKRLHGPHPLPTWFQLEIAKTSHNMGYAGNRYNGAKPAILKNGDVIWLRFLLMGERIEILRFEKK